jgi:hypothetical protein
VNRRLTAALLAGLALGAGAAALVQGDRGNEVRAATTPQLVPVRSAPALPPFRMQGRTRRITSVSRLPAVADPSGDPPWSVRVWRGEIVTPSRRAGRPPFRLPQHCAELGRVFRGRFGWVYPDRRFRPAAPGQLDIQGVCISERRPEPDVRAALELAFPTPSEPKPTAGVVWGLVPPSTREVRVEGVAGGTRTLRPGEDGTVLLVTAPGALPTTTTRVTTEGTTVRVRLDTRRRGGRLGAPIVAGSETVDVRAPDPRGGPAHGLVAGRTASGRWCVIGEAQAVGDRFGFVDSAAGMFFSTSFGTRCPTQPPPPTRKRPLMISGGFGSTGSRDVLAARARVERRVPDGLGTLTAICHPSVDHVTVRTPDSIRALTPSPRAHAIFVIYAGRNVAGETVITAHLKDGSVYQQRFPSGF